MSIFLKLVIPVIIVITAGVLYFFVFTGMIKVDSPRPSGAEVQIDGVVVGNTPLMKRVRAGVRQVTVSKDGFETWSGEVKVSGMSASLLSVRLRFLLRSDPTGAKVIMNGKHIGVTDMPVDLKPGIYVFEFKKDGFEVAKFRANIPPDVNSSVPLVTLTPARARPPEEIVPVEETKPSGHGSIQVTSTPDAQVYLDSEWQGETPLTIKKVPAGSYVITLSREGYRDLRQTVYVKKDETSRVAEELKPESAEQTP